MRELPGPDSAGDDLAHSARASRGNLLSGEAEKAILTVSRLAEEKRANPGYRAFFANGFNVTRSLVLFGWEVVLEWTAAIRAARRDVRPRGLRDLAPATVSGVALGYPKLELALWVGTGQGLVVGYLFLIDTAVA